MMYLPILLAMSFSAFVGAASSSLPHARDLQGVHVAPLGSETAIGECELGACFQGLSEEDFDSNLVRVRTVPAGQKEVNLAVTASKNSRENMYHTTWQLLRLGDQMPNHVADELTLAIASNGCSGECKKRMSDLSKQLMLCERCSLLATIAKRRAGESKIVTGVSCPGLLSKPKPVQAYLVPMFNLGQSVAGDLKTP